MGEIREGEEEREILRVERKGKEEAMVEGNIKERGGKGGERGKKQISAAGTN